MPSLAATNEIWLDLVGWALLGLSATIRPQFLPELAVVGLLVYGHTLEAPLQYDDFYVIGQELAKSRSLLGSPPDEAVGIWPTPVERCALFQEQLHRHHADARV